MDPVRYHDGIHEDIDASCAWYDKKQPGLSCRFAAEVRTAFDKIEANPFDWPAREKSGVWKYPIDRFPFNVIYLDRPGCVWIVAVAHTSRRPNYWRKRLKDIP